MLAKTLDIRSEEANTPYEVRVQRQIDAQQTAGMGSEKLLMFAGIAVIGYLLLVPKKKTKSSGGLNGAKRKKRKAGKKRK